MSYITGLSVSYCNRQGSNRYTVKISYVYSPSQLQYRKLWSILKFQIIEYDTFEIVKSLFSVQGVS